MDTYMYLFAPNDLENYLYYSDDYNDDDWNSKIIFECDTSGTYYIMVRHYDVDEFEGSEGSYEIAVTIDNDFQPAFSFFQMDSFKTK